MVHGALRKSLAFLVTVTIASQVSASGVEWSTNVESGLLSAKQSGKLVLMKFTADWCGYCKKMERETFTRPAVSKLVTQQFVPILVDADQHKDLVKHLEIQGLPAILIVSPEMVILQRIKGYKTERELLPVLNTIVASHRQSFHTDTSIAGSQNVSPTPTRPVSNQLPQQTTYQQTQPDSRPAVFDEPAFGGLCLPGVNESRSLISGMPQLARRYRGKTLYFSTQEMADKFASSPEKYWPQRDGACPVTLLEAGQIVEGKLEYAAMFRGKLWVTSSPKAMEKFVASPARYVDALTQ